MSAQIECIQRSSSSFHRFVKLYVPRVYVLFYILYPLLWFSALISPSNYGTVHHFYWQPFTAHP